MERDLVGLSREPPVGGYGAALAKLAGVPEGNVGGVIRFGIPDAQGVASPLFRDIPGFVGGGQTTGELPEFVIPNQPVGNFDYTLELPPGH
jgi:hypothetical protein